MKAHFLWLLKNKEIEIQGGTLYASGAEKKKTGTDSSVWLFDTTMGFLDDSNVLVFEIAMDYFFIVFYFF